MYFLDDHIYKQVSHTRERESLHGAVNSLTIMSETSGRESSVHDIVQRYLREHNLGDGDAVEHAGDKGDEDAPHGGATTIHAPVPSQRPPPARHSVPPTEASVPMNATPACVR